MKLTIATRRSRLAVWQAEFVATRLRETSPGCDVELLPLSTSGDRILDTSLAKIGGKGLFIKELEQALAQGAADLAVHSMKDVPAEMPQGFCIAAVLERHDPRDALLGSTLAQLPPGARVGTSSLRRAGQLAIRRPDLVIEPLRGNVETRIGKLDRGEVDAIMLAVAGLARLGLEERIAEAFDPGSFVPAIGQGAIGVECLDNSPAVAAVARLDDRYTRLAVEAERELSRRLEASCVSPLAGYALVAGDEILLHGLVASPDGDDMISAIASGTDATTVGRQAAQRLLRHGAGALIRAGNG